MENDVSELSLKENRRKTMNGVFGAHFFHVNKKQHFIPGGDQLYYFETFVGEQELEVSLGDCVYYFSKDLETALVEPGPTRIKSSHLATVLRGYMHPKASFSLHGATTLPYVNGCSTKQIFAPIRQGDPTLQYLKMPPFSKEQEHHVHSTFRVVLILSGKGKSIVGIEGKNEETELVPGSVCILEPMCPHHFETHSEEPLVAVPLHVFSSIGSMERNHPMFNGTVII